MKKPILKLTLAILAGSLASSQAASVSISDFAGTTSNVIVSSFGNQQLTSSAVLQIMYFRNYVAANPAASDALIRAGLGSTQTREALQTFISSNFIPLGTGGVMGTPSPTNPPRIANRLVNGVDTPGRAQGQIATVTPTASPANTQDVGGVPAGTRLFLMVWDTAPGSATELGVFSADAAAWRMTASASGANILNTTNVDTPAEIYRGSSGSLVLAPIVPEPSTGVMALLVAAGLISRRRR